MDLGLTRKRALVTGASRGIGRATVARLAAEGCDLAICARGADDLAAYTAELEAEGVTVFSRAVDVADEAALIAFIDDSAAALGGLDLLVNNVSAGSQKGPDAWAVSLATDLVPLVRSIETVVPHFEAAGGGSIVAIATTSAFDTAIPASPSSYSALKAAVITHASGMAHKLGPLGIRVNTVSPGPIYFTDGPWQAVKDARPEFYDSVVASIPVGRMGTAEEVANAVAFLGSPAASFCNGVNLVCDGGMVTRVQF